ncbi:uncharacterized protein LOC127244337 [Andrographis paniculata]|uniref:uncharacterized protein LOC127244337 n=1 Tax=Andrographis paniculata TaxID=175694 RepID=UPI0021E7342D|nr:uncharacterized protein LOC127244337 [Andrographis paniculata]
MTNPTHLTPLSQNQIIFSRHRPRTRIELTLPFFCANLTLPFPFSPDHRCCCRRRSPLLPPSLPLSNFYVLHLLNFMDPKHTGDVLKHLEKQHELLMEAYRSMSHELHTLQVEEEMLMKKYYEYMVAQGFEKSKTCTNATNLDGSGQAGAIVPITKEEQPQGGQ